MKLSEKLIDPVGAEVFVGVPAEGDNILNTHMTLWPDLRNDEFGEGENYVYDGRFSGGEALIFGRIEDSVLVRSLDSHLNAMRREGDPITSDFADKLAKVAEGLGARVQ
jgi:hypothetical protein